VSHLQEAIDMYEQRLNDPYLTDVEFETILSRLAALRKEMAT
jgi:hypothetical protein